MLLKARDALMKDCGLSKSGPSPCRCSSWSCENWEWDAKTVPEKFEFTTDNKEAQLGRCGLNNPGSRAVMSRKV